MNDFLVEQWLALQQTIRALQVEGGDCEWFNLHLTMTQWKVLFLVVRSDGLPGRTIAERLAIGPSAVTPLVDRLVKLKLARREADPTDRRVVKITPTAKAFELHDALMQVGRATFTAVLKEVPATEIEGVRRALSVLRDTAERVRARRLKETVTK